MGITGLLPFLKHSTRQASIKEFKGCTVAIDSYCWLHKGAFACAEKLALGEPTDQYVYYCMKYVNNLLSYGVRPLLVFDGCHLPSKKEVESQRRERRQVNRKKAAQLLREGRRSEARDALQKCIDITSHMAVELMNACRAKGVDCIVAPYEADSQLAYLNKAGIAQVIITEDSDLILFGCDKVMFKMDFAGNGMLIESQHLNKAMGLNPDVYTFDKFRYMCILSGCDYLASLPGIGLKKATRIFQRTRQTDMKLVLKKIPATLNMNNVTVTTDYIEGFFKADNTFLYQIVYDPIRRKLLPLNPYPDDVDPSQLLYAGPPMGEGKAYQLALGNLDVHTGAQIADFDPETFQPSKSWDPVAGRGSRAMLHNLSIWDNNYRPKSKLAVERDMTKGSAFDISRGTTKGKEVNVSLKLPGISKKKVSPRKRHREDEDSSLSDRDLADLYTGTRADDEGHSYKKRKSEDPPRSTEITGPMSKSPQRAEYDQPRSPTPPPADMNTSFTTEKDQLNTSDSKLRSPEDSPRTAINRFRVSSSVQKNRFNLNATTTEVTSRFFNYKKPFKKSEFFDKIALPHNDTSIKLESTETGDVTENHDLNTENDNELEQDDKQASTERELSQVSKKSDFETSANSVEQISQSPYGSFSFNINKLSSFKSTFDRNSSLKSTSVSQTQFKPVANRDSLEKDSTHRKHVSFSNLSSNENSELNTSHSSEPLSEKQDSTQDTATQRSVSLWSIDSFSLSQSYTENVDLTDGDERSGKLSQGLDMPRTSGQSTLATSAYFGTTKSASDVGVSNVLYQNKSPVSKACGSGKSPKAGCRSSGLSKKSKSFSSKENSANGQKSITNFFNKFCYDKSAQNKMDTNKKPLSPSRDTNLSLQTER